MVLRIAIIQHKSCKYHDILDLSYKIQSKDQIIKSVNETMIKTASRGAMDEMGHVLNHTIHAYAEQTMKRRSLQQQMISNMSFGGVWQKKERSGILHTFFHR